jgi:hypothetical protein
MEVFAMHQATPTDQEFCGRGQLVSCSTVRCDVYYYVLLAARRHGPPASATTPQPASAVAICGHFMPLHDGAEPLYADAEHSLILADGTELPIALRHHSTEPITLYAFAAELAPDSA